MRIFETDRLIVRQLDYDDLEPFHDMQGNNNVMRYIKKTLTFEESKNELERYIGYYNDKNRLFYFWAVVDKNTTDFLGACGVYANQQSEYEVFYRFREAHWGNGYGNEIATRLIEYCFKNLDLPEITAYASMGNTGSIKILESHMQFSHEFYSEKLGSYERVYKLKRQRPPS